MATGIGGVLVVCAETTAQVIAARRMTEEHERLAELFGQAPSFMAMLRAPSIDLHSSIQLTGV